MGNFKGVIVTFLLSHTSWILLYFVEKFAIMESISTIFMPLGFAALFGVISCLKYILPPSALSKNNKKIEERGLIYYKSCLFCWTCIVDGIFYLEALNIVSGFTGFYLKIGEPYLGTSFGTLCNVWDAIVHYVLYLRIIYCIDNGKDYRNVALFNLGSMLASMILLLIGGLGGVYGGLYPATFLNLPFVFVPVYALLIVVNSPRKSTTSTKRSETLKNKSLRNFVLVSTCLVAVFGFMRGLAALESPHPVSTYYTQHVEPYLVEPGKFGTVWALLMLFVGPIFQVSTVYAIFHPGCTWLLDWSVFYAGLSVYGSVLQMAQFFTGITPEFHPPSHMQFVVVVANTMVALVAVLTAYLIHSEPEYFMKPTPKKVGQSQQNPTPKKVVQSQQNPTPKKVGQSPKKQTKKDK